MNRKHIIWAIALVVLLAYAGYTAAVNIQGTYNIDIDDEAYDYYAALLQERNITLQQAVNWILTNAVEEDYAIVTEDQLGDEFHKLLQSKNMTKYRAALNGLIFINNQ